VQAATATEVETVATTGQLVILAMIAVLQVVTESQHHAVVVAALTTVDLMMTEKDRLAANFKY
jgi:hypothetical protein